MPNIDDLTLSPRQHTEASEVVPKILADLRQLSESIISDTIRYRDMLEADGEWAKAANINIKFLPYLLSKKKELEELTANSLICQLNVSLVTERDCGARELGAELYRASRDLPENLGTLDTQHALALKDFYHMMTGHRSVNGERLQSRADIERSVLIKYGHSEQAKLIK
ncbi:hypothetical protein P3911_004479 [Salmonella enterica]|nr:hypothetical protein [Salmonella enterica]